MDIVEVGGTHKATAVERYIVRDKSIEFVEICLFDFFPYVRKVGGILRILRPDTVKHDVLVVIIIVRRTDKPGFRLGDLSVTDHADTGFADGSPLICGCLEIYGYKVQIGIFHFVKV